MVEAEKKKEVVRPNLKAFQGSEQGDAARVVSLPLNRGIFALLRQLRQTMRSSSAPRPSSS